MRRVEGRPGPARVSTSYAERQNLSMRMGLRRFPRLTDAVSEKFENHVHAISVNSMHYSFIRIRQTLRCAPATGAGVTSRCTQ